MVLLFLFPFYGVAYCSYIESCWEIYSIFILSSFKCYTIKLWVQILILEILRSSPLSVSKEELMLANKILKSSPLSLSKEELVLANKHCVSNTMIID